MHIKYMQHIKDIQNKITKKLIKFMNPGDIVLMTCFAISMSSTIYVLTFPYKRSNSIK